MTQITKEHDFGLTTHFFSDVYSFIDWTPPEDASGSLALYNSKVEDNYEYRNMAKGDYVKQHINNHAIVKDFDKDTQHVSRPVVKKALKKLVESERLNIQYAEAGIMLDPVAAMLGEDDCMIDIMPDTQEKPIMWFAMPVSASVHCEQASFSRRAKALIYIIEAYETIGISVGLLAFDGTEYNNKKDYQIVQVKAPDEYINQNTLTNLLSMSEITTAIALSRGTYHLGNTWGGSDIDLTPHVVSQANSSIDTKALIIVSSRLAGELALDGNDGQAAQKLLDAASDQLIKLMQTNKGV